MIKLVYNVQARCPYGRADAYKYGGIDLAIFGSGVHPKDCKSLSSGVPIGRMADPQKVRWGSVIRDALPISICRLCTMPLQS